MFLDKTKKNQGFTTRLFEAAINKGKLAHAYMLTQSQAHVQYEFALELAKLLNCPNKTDGTPCETCMDCKWISENNHPALITVSPVDFLPTKADTSTDGTTSKSKNTIKVAQARLLQKQLIISSKYHRVVIFTGATDDASTVSALKASYTYNFKPPATENDREYWEPLHLDREIFSADVANILLKTIEEPSSNILFIFITKDPEDMLDTIVSRCQTVSMNAIKEHTTLEDEYIFKLEALIPPQNELDAIKAAKCIVDFSKSEQMSLPLILDYYETIYKKKLFQAVQQQGFTPHYLKAIQAIEAAKRNLKGYVHPQATLQQMFNHLIQ